MEGVEGGGRELGGVEGVEEGRGGGCFSGLELRQDKS